MSPSTSARWCPTPEQLMILEEMYRAGVRTPSASQIQQITAHLSLYGKIEGKNVFYWFQNHKARDRQKMRRKLTKQLQQQQQLFQQHVSPSCCSLCHSYLDHHQCPASASAFRQLSYYSPSLPPPPSSPLPSMIYAPQGGNTTGGGQMLTMDCNKWTETIRDVPRSRVEMEKSMMKMYNGDWMMVLDMDPSEFCPAKPLKTLELFPTTSTNLGEDSKDSATQPV
ncbi:hypothetical protein SAY87_017908 [Trapa incisa]|uniref:Homeobox domain-containing protein n=1 Tax=Trapa incisa TaxID=236973 RepID=A0AAN7QUQ8_9MYRT|nr:hypothetical protein SAY87_017908 [Trapa incisa]